MGASVRRSIPQARRRASRTGRRRDAPALHYPDGGVVVFAHVAVETEVLRPVEAALDAGRGCREDADRLREEGLHSGADTVDVVLVDAERGDDADIRKSQRVPEPGVPVDAVGAVIWEILLFVHIEPAQDVHRVHRVVAGV